MPVLQGLTEAQADERNASNGWLSPFNTALDTTTATVRRRACEGAPPILREVPIADLAVGDVVLLEPGDPIPVHLRLVRGSAMAVVIGR
jgi:magnesium-transporting ATPase (P-type)